MDLLPKWAITTTLPSVRDFESATVIEMTAKLYGAMQTMVSEYNSFADKINDEFSKLTGAGESQISEFKETVERRLACKFEEMDKLIAKTKLEIKQHITDRVGEIINEKIAAGEIEITLVYDPVTETLNIAAGEV